VKLVVLTAAYPAPSEPERAVYIETLTRAIVQGEPNSAREPLEVVIVAPRVSPADPLEEVRDGLTVRRFRYPSMGKRLKELRRPSVWRLGAYFVSGLAATLEEVRRRPADLILCHWVLPVGPIAAVASVLLGVPLVAVAHGSDLNRYAWSSTLLHRLALATVTQARHIVAVSAELGAVLVERLRVPSRRVTVVPMGVDPHCFSVPRAVGGNHGTHETHEARNARRRSLGLEPGRRLLVFVGDLIPEKGVQDLLEAQQTLLQRGLEVDLCLLGEGELREQARSVSGAGSVPVHGQVLCPGRVSQAELASWYRAADLFVLPSHAEGSPVTVMEALASGLPVVASRVGGIPDLVDDPLTGWLVPPRDPRVLSNTLEGLLRNPESIEAARKRLVENPPDFSVMRRAKDVRRILDEVLCGGE
jgi:glycosyltransferase involved in cell wall biosynthesis